MAALTKNDLRDYVLEAKRTTLKGDVLLDLKHNLTTRHFAEILFHLDSEIEDVRYKIYTLSGTKPEFMELRFNDLILEDGRLLGEYGVQNNDIIHVYDHDPDSVAANGALDDVSLVERFRMSDEEYDKRPNTYRKWKAEQLAKDPHWLPPWVLKEREKRAALRELNPIEDIESVKSRFKVGDRCECYPGGRRGEIKFIGYFGSGPVTYADGYVEAAHVWIGVEFDEPVGKNDGSFKDKRYFTCQQGYGGFLKPEFVTVGDFPENDPFDTDDEEDAEDIMEEL